MPSAPRGGGERRPEPGASSAVARTVSPSQGPAGAVPPPPVAQAQAYSHVQDRVVQALLRRGLVTAEQVTAAEVARKNASSRDPLWRSLVGQKGVDRNHVFEQAAAT